jgi:hypothetical protein
VVTQMSIVWPLFCEDEMFGEEYTLVACADYVLVKLWKYGFEHVFFSCFDVTNPIREVMKQAL